MHFHILLVEEKIARSIVEIERYGSRMIKVKIKAEPVDIVIIQVYMPTTNHEEEEVENNVREAGRSTG